MIKLQVNLKNIMGNSSEKVPGADNQQENPPNYELGLASVANNLIVRLGRLRDSKKLMISLEESQKLADRLAVINEELKMVEAKLEQKS